MIIYEYSKYTIDYVAVANSLNALALPNEGYHGAMIFTFAKQTELPDSPHQKIIRRGLQASGRVDASSKPCPH